MTSSSGCSFPYRYLQARPLNSWHRSSVFVSCWVFWFFFLSLSFLLFWSVQLEAPPGRRSVGAILGAPGRWGARVVTSSGFSDQGWCLHQPSHTRCSVLDTIVPPASAPRAVTATLSGGIRRLSSAGRGRGRVDGRTLPRTCSAARSLGLPRSARVLKRCVDLGSTSHLPASICCCTSLTVRVGAARYGAPPSRYPFREEQRDCSRVAGHACGARCRRPSFTPEEVGTRFPRLLSTPHGWRL